MRVRNIRSELSMNKIKVLLVANKIDDDNEDEFKEKFRDFESIVFISAKNGLHLEILKERMVDTVLQGQCRQKILSSQMHDIFMH